MRNCQKKCGEGKMTSQEYINKILDQVDDINKRIDRINSILIQTKTLIDEFKEGKDEHRYSRT
jgi:hypothetical protein